MCSWSQFAWASQHFLKVILKRALCRDFAEIVTPALPLLAAVAAAEALLAALAAAAPAEVAPAAVAAAAACDNEKSEFKHIQSKYSC